MERRGEKPNLGDSIRAIHLVISGIPPKLVKRSIELRVRSRNVEQDRATFQDEKDLLKDYHELNKDFYGHIFGK